MSRYTKEEAASKLQNFYKENGKCTRRLYDKFKQRPSSVTILKIFGTWNNALQNAGVPMSNKKYSDEEIIKVLRDFYKNNNFYITFSQFKKSELNPRPRTIINQFGSWNQALLAAELPINIATKYGKIDDIGICPTCNHEFYLRKYSQIYCSNTCYQKNLQKLKAERREKGLCIKCGSELINKTIHEDDNIIKWKCRECNHEWQKLIKRSSGRPRKKKFIDEFPQIAEEYCANKNRKSIQKVSISDSKKYWWRCKNCKEEWLDAASNRIQHPECPYCEGIKKKIDKSKFTNNFNFKTKLIDYPDIVNEWHPTKNDNTYPDKFKKDSKSIAWWKCSKCDTDWISKIVDRVNKTKKCPTCYPRVFGKVIGDNTKDC